MNNALTFSQIKPLLFADLKAEQTPALLGEPGIGKSALIEDLAREFKTKVFTLPVNQLADRADLTGVRMTKDKDGNYGQSFFPHETIMSAISYAQNNPDEHPILFLDEFNRASSDITSAILSFQTLRRIGTINFPDNLRLVVAGNDSGNVTSLDKASISRFSVYKVIPDVATFLSVQELNPFVASVMQKHPEDLLAPQLVDVIESDDDDDEDDNDMFSLESEFLDDDGFEQVTVPRTITYTSDWLTHMGLDKSGSDEELEVLTNLLSGTNTDESGDVLRAGLVAHAGHTEFTQHLYDELHEYFNQAIAGVTTSNNSVLGKFRPEQDLINQLSKAKDTTEVSNIVTTLSTDEKQSLLIWLFEVRSAREINNNDIVTATIREVSHNIDSFDPTYMQGLNTILANNSSANEQGIVEFINSGSSIANMYKDFISATLGL